MAIPASIDKFLKESGMDYSLLEHPRAFTAQEEAAVTHVPGKAWAKAVVCFADDQPILAVLPAHHTVDEARLRSVVGARSLRLAKEDEFVSLYPDCEAGAMPPFGPLFSQRVFVDRSLASDPEIVFNAGTHTDAIRMRYGDFAALVRPVVGDFAEAPWRAAKG
jgi:Ala-tRNA(Pro) deacylase